MTAKLEILEQYSELAPKLPQLVESLELAINQLIKAKGFKTLSLNGRVKSHRGLAQKLSRPDKNFKYLLDVTDLVAFRIITYSEDVIQDIARMIEEDFEVDFNISINKLRILDDQKFGYRSLHYICSIPKEILASLTWPNPKLKFEIQIRTILQHTWAEIEHELGYKATEKLPSNFRRRLSQMASLLEVADREFVSIKADIKLYEGELKKAALDGVEQIEMDLLSLNKLLATSEVKLLDEKISLILGKSVVDEIFYPDYLLKALHAADLKKAHVVLMEVSRNRDLMGAFVEAYFKFTKDQWNFDQSSVESVKRGYGLLFIAHLAIIRSENLVIDRINKLAQFYHIIDFQDDLAKARAAGQGLIGQLKLSNFPHLDKDPKVVS